MVTPGPSGALTDRSLSSCKRTASGQDTIDIVHIARFDFDQPDWVVGVDTNGEPIEQRRALPIIRIAHVLNFALRLMRLEHEGAGADRILVEGRSILAPCCRANLIGSR